MVRTNPLELPTKTETLASLPEWYHVVACCPNCLRGEVVSRKFLAWKIGMDTPLWNAVGRLRCTVCRERGRCVFTIARRPR